MEPLGKEERHRRLAGAGLWGVDPPAVFRAVEVGERFYIPSRTQSDALFYAFQLASGDNHPIHYDRHYCQKLGHRDMLAHGYQVAIQTCAGAGIMPFVMGEAMIAFLEQSSRFLAPGWGYSSTSCRGGGDCPS